MLVLAAIHPTGVALYVLILVLDLYLVAAGIRIVLSFADAYWARRLVMRLARFTDPILLATGDAMAVHGTPAPLWLSYVVVLLTGTTLHGTLAWVALHFR